VTEVQAVISALEVVVGQKRQRQARSYGRRLARSQLIEPRRTIGSWTCSTYWQTRPLGPGRSTMRRRIGPLRYVEDVSGRLTTGRSAALGAAQGAMLGLLFGLLFGLFFSDAASFFGVVLYGLVAGTAWVATWGALLHYAQRGRRDFGSMVRTVADRYEVQVDDQVADEAARLLERMSRG
jgi:hypothetical protein